MPLPFIIVMCLTILTFVGLAIWWFFFAIKFNWPEGETFTRKTSKGTKVVFINSFIKTPLLNLKDLCTIPYNCTCAVECCFDAWRQLHSKTNPEKMIPVLGVQFVSDSFMDSYQKKIWGPNAKINAFMDRVNRAHGSDAPMAVIRCSMAELLLKTGKPLIHECVHALLGAYTGNVDYYHSTSEWTSTVPLAEQLYYDKNYR